MDIDILAFFDNRPQELELYEALLDRLITMDWNFSVKVQKTQISLYSQHMFACVSFARVRKKTRLPSNYIVVTFGLTHPETSGRIAVCTEAAPNRWTHHVVVGSVQEIDEELLSWISEAYAFSNRK